MTEEVLIVLSTKQNRNFNRKPRQGWKKIFRKILAFVREVVVTVVGGLILAAILG